MSDEPTPVAPATPTPSPVAPAAPPKVAVVNSPAAPVVLPPIAVPAPIAPSPVPSPAPPASEAAEFGVLGRDLIPGEKAKPGLIAFTTEHVPHGMGAPEELVAGLVFACPKCGVADVQPVPPQRHNPSLLGRSGAAGLETREALTTDAFLISFAPPLACAACGWKGVLRNGEFVTLPDPATPPGNHPRSGAAGA